MEMDSELRDSLNNSVPLEEREREREREREGDPVALDGKRS